MPASGIVNFESPKYSIVIGGVKVQFYRRSQSLIQRLQPERSTVVMENDFKERNSRSIRVDLDYNVARKSHEDPSLKTELEDQEQLLKWEAYLLLFMEQTKEELILAEKDRNDV